MISNLRICWVRYWWCQLSWWMCSWQMRHRCFFVCYCCCTWTCWVRWWWWCQLAWGQRLCQRRQMCLGCDCCCTWTQMRNTVLIQPSTTVSASSIQALPDTLRLFLIFSVKTTVWALLADMWNILRKEISFFTSATTNAVQESSTGSSYYFKLRTLLTAVTRSWIKFVWKCLIWTRLAANITGWMCNFLSAHRIQSIARMAFSTFKAIRRAAICHSILVCSTDNLSTLHM